MTDTVYALYHIPTDGYINIDLGYLDEDDTYIRMLTSVNKIYKATMMELPENLIRDLEGAIWVDDETSVNIDEFKILKLELTYPANEI